MYTIWQSNCRGEKAGKTNGDRSNLQREKQIFIQTKRDRATKESAKDTDEKAVSEGIGLLRNFKYATPFAFQAKYSF